MNENKKLQISTKSNKFVEHSVRVKIEQTLN